MRGALLLSALLACLLPAAAAAAPAPRSIFEDDALLLRSGDLARERGLDDMRALGVDAIRVLVVWRDYAPARRPPGFDAAAPDAYPLGALDAVIAGATARGMDVLLTPTGPGPRRSPFDPKEFGRFVTALGRRYPDQRHWAIWNEPNNPRWLRPQYVRRRPASPGRYRRLVLAAAGALRATGHGGDELLVGETAPIGHVTGRTATTPMMPAPFLRALLCRGCPRVPATGLSHHAYTRGGSAAPRTRGLPGELGVGQLGELVRLARGLPVHLTEGGWQTSPPDVLFGVPLGRQAMWMNELEWMARARPRIKSVPQYLLYDELANGGFQSGLRFRSGRPKPAYAAYRLPVWAVRRGRTVTVWGRVRPAGPGGDGTVAIQRRLAHGHWRTLATTRADDDLVVRLRAASGHWRLVWRGMRSRTAAESRR